MNKKEELLIRAAQIIYEEGMHRLTFDYLARTSNITKGGILYHFKSKSQLLLQMNKMAVTKFEDILDYYISQLTGPSLFTRAYAYATLDFFKTPETALLPAVFISSLEDEKSFKIWESISKNWDYKFQNDSGSYNENLKLKLICDGVWFSILYATDDSFNYNIEKIILDFCHSLERGVF